MPPEEKLIDAQPVVLEAGDADVKLSPHGLFSHLGATIIFTKSTPWERPHQGMFIITFVCRPIAKFMLKHPVVAGVVILALYLFIAYRCLLSAWDANYRRTAGHDEIAERWQRQMAYTRRK